MQTDERTDQISLEASEQGARLGSAVGSALGVAAGKALEVGQAVTDTARDVGGQVRDRAAESDLPERASVMAHLLEGYLEQGRERGGELVSTAGRAVQRRTAATPPPRRWAWAIAAALLGAAAGAAVAFALRSVLGADAPGAQEPDQLRAVVDVPPPTADGAAPRP